MLWALDKSLWDWVLDECMVKKEVGNEIFTMLLDQYNELATNGVRYVLNRKEITEKHFDFKNTIIQELSLQLYLLQALKNQIRGEAEIDEHWVEGVGGAQKLFPMHVVSAYCGNDYLQDEFFLTKNYTQNYFNRISDRMEDWFAADSKLGIDFAFAKGGSRLCALDKNGKGLTSSVYDGPLDDSVVRRLCHREEKIKKDIEALIILHKVRTQDFIDLKKELELQVRVNNHLQDISSMTINEEKAPKV